MAKAAHRLFGDAGDPMTNEQSSQAEPSRPVSGKDLLAALESAGIIGMWANRNGIGDPRDYASRLRRQAQQR